MVRTITHAMLFLVTSRIRITTLMSICPVFYRVFLAQYKIKITDYPRASMTPRFTESSRLTH